MAEKTINRRKAKVRLLCTRSGMNGGLVIAERELAMRVARITNAIETAKTWGEFRQLMPRADYSEVIRDSFDENGEPRPKGTDPFESGQVCGYTDGDYPPWLQQEMLRLFSSKLLEDLEKWGTVEATFVNGAYLHLDPKSFPEIKEVLERNGYVLENASDLDFR